MKTPYRIMRILHRILPVLLVCSCAAIAAEKSDSEDYGLIGPVRSIIVEGAKLTEESGKWVEGPRSCSYAAVYNAEGNMVEEARYWHYGPFKSKSIYKYDAVGNKIEEGYYSRDGTLAWKRFYRHDSQGNLTQEVHYKADTYLRGQYSDLYDTREHKTASVTYDTVGSLRWRHAFAYDSKGNVSEESWYRADDSLDCRIAYTYDSKGNKTEAAKYGRDGKPDWKSVFTYDGEDRKTMGTWWWYKGDPPPSLVGASSRKLVCRYHVSGNIAQKTWYKADGSLLRKNVYVYDSHGNCTEVNCYDAKGCVTYHGLYKYDANGNLIEEQNDYRDSSEKYELTYVYNDKGHIVKELSWDVEYNTDGSIESEDFEGYVRHYEYDSQGNWVKRTVSDLVGDPDQLQFEPRRVTYRSITYFEPHRWPETIGLETNFVQKAEDGPKSKTDPQNRPSARHKRYGLADYWPAIQVQVGLYEDDQCNERCSFFDRSGQTSPKSVHYTIKSESLGSGIAVNLIGGLYNPDGVLAQDLSGLSTDSSGSYRGSYAFKKADKPGVWLLKVGCEESGCLSASGIRSLHLYAGSGVSSYRMDFDRTSFQEESVLENRHLVAVFGNAKVSNKALLYVYQKDTGTQYCFGKTNIGRFDYMYNRFDGFGEVTSDQSIQRTFSCNLRRESENLSKASATLDVNLVYPLNEISHGACRKLSIWKKKDQSDYERVWACAPGIFEAADHAVGDADNDGKNEIVWVTSSGTLYVVEHTCGTYNISWTSERILGGQPRVNIADTDNDGQNEIAVAAGGKSMLLFFKYDGGDYQMVASKAIPGKNACSVEVGDFDKDGANETVTACRESSLHMYEYDGSDYEEVERYIFSDAIFGTKNSDSGDIDGDGFPELLVGGGSKQFVIIDYADGSFTTTYKENVSATDVDSWAVGSCHFGDPDNDGQLEVLVGANHKLMYYEYASLSDFRNVWCSSEFGGRWLRNMIEVEDGDSDGLNEILFIKPTGKKPGTGDPSMWGNKTGGHRSPNSGHTIHLALMKTATICTVSTPTLMVIKRNLVLK